MKVIRQHNEWDCLVATCMMITGCEYEECAKALWDGEAYSVVNLIKFCMTKDIIVGITAYPANDEGEVYSEYGIDKGKLLNAPAYISVQSEFNKKYSHACYYDGEKICDPATGERRDVEEMHILMWWPINTFDDLFDRSPIEDKDLKAAIAKANKIAYTHA